jgi:hypothetical protein
MTRLIVPVVAVGAAEPPGDDDPESPDPPHPEIAAASDDTANDFAAYLEAAAKDSMTLYRADRPPRLSRPMR